VRDCACVGACVCVRVCASVCVRARESLEAEEDVLFSRLGSFLFLTLSVVVLCVCAPMNSHRDCERQSRGDSKRKEKVRMCVWGVEGEREGTRE